MKFNFGRYIFSSVLILLIIYPNAHAQNDGIQVLPGSKLGSDTNGIILCDVGDVRSMPAKEAELTTQVLMGTVVKLLKKENGYYYIQMPDNYLGWIDSANVFITDPDGVNKWNNARKVIITAFKATIWKNPGTSSGVQCHAVTGCILESDSTKDGWTSVELPNGHKGFIADSVVQNLDEWKKSRHLTGDNLEKTAKELLGIPYLWGGTSVRAMDCSGFVKTVYRLNGMELQRDAYQQAKQGTGVEPGKNFQNLRKGDLLFFGQKATRAQPEHITHVGLYLENRLFIHSFKSSGKVYYSSFNPASKYYYKSLVKQFVRARRLF
jgi:cell wall-associated NlpC family hydrolase